MNGSVRQAANLALLEVDRGLLSGNIGDQCEAIMQFPCLIDQFPLPVLISAAFLKLTDKFVSSHQNTIRQCISQVMVLCSKHLHKVTNIDDIFQKICTVFHSNDPVARGLTLSVFGAMSPLIADKKIVLQSVLKGLDSNHQYEQNAAIEAAHELCQYSRTFAVGICCQVSSMIHDVATSMVLRLKLVHILEVMYHDIDLALKARHLCAELLLAYPSVGFAIVLIETLTKLAMSTCVHAENQIEFLINLSEKETRANVRLKIFCDLQRMSLKCVHSWNAQGIESVFALTVRMTRIHEKLKLLGVIKSIAMSSISHLVLPHQETLLVMCSHPHWGIASRACNILATLDSSSILPISVDVMCIAESLFTRYLQESDMLSFKVLCSNLVKLCGKCSDSVVVQTVHILSRAVHFLDQSKAEVCCKMLEDIAVKDVSVSKYVSEHLLKILDRNMKMLYPVCVTVMKIHSTFQRAIANQFISNLYWLEKKIIHHINHNSCVSMYDILFLLAREASCKGFHRLAGYLYRKLADIVECEQHYYWLLSLGEISDSCLSLSEIEIVRKSVKGAMDKALSAQQYVKACGRTDTFLDGFIVGYILYLEALSHLFVSCDTLFMESIHTIVEYNISKFEKAENHFQGLKLSSFDANSQTIQVLLDCQNSCKFVCYLLNSFLPGSVDEERPFEIEREDESVNVNSQFLLILSKEVTELRKTLEEPVPFVLSCVTKLLKYHPLQLPDMIFGSKQQTNVQLITLPSLSEQECIPVPIGSHFSLVVEGIIDQTNACYRIPRQAIATVSLTALGLKISTSKNVQVNGDYFKACFSIRISSTEIHRGSLSVSLVDTLGKQWITGQCLPFLLKNM